MRKWSKLANANKKLSCESTLISTKFRLIFYFKHESWVRWIESEILISVKIGLSRIKYNTDPPVEDIYFFWWISSEIYRDHPGIFPFFCIDSPLNSWFFLASIFWCTPLGIQRLLLYPPGIFHWYPQQGG